MRDKINLVAGILNLSISLFLVAYLSKGIEWIIVFGVNMFSAVINLGVFVRESRRGDEYVK